MFAKKITVIQILIGLLHLKLLLMINLKLEFFSKIFIQKVIRVLPSDSLLFTKL